MSELSRAVRSRRRQLGLSQVDLAVDAHVSVATVQKLEAGRANPSLSTLRAMFAPLGLSLGLESGGADWDVLAAHGLPLTSASSRVIRPDEATLARQLRLAALEVVGCPPDSDRDRKRDTVRALLLALRNHFPTWFRRISRSGAVSSLLAEEPSGRVVKLARIAAGGLAELL